MAAELFTIQGKIAVEIGSAQKEIERVKKAAEGTSKGLDELDSAAKTTGKSTKDLGKNAEDTGSKVQKSGDKTEGWRKTVANAASGIEKAGEKCGEFVKKVSDAGEKTDSSGSKISNAFKKIGTAVSSFFKKEPIDNMTKSVSGLTKTISGQETKLEALKKKYQDLYLSQGKNSDEAKNCAKEIEKLSSELQDNKEKLSEAEKAADKFDKTLQDTGDSANEAADGFTVWKGVISGVVSNAITGLISKCAELAAKMVELTQTAVSNYADYEQLVGGVETLFKDSSDTLIGYAENAYKTAGMSSNEYMETATSFAASLIQGLGGDTAKAVEVTNMAITDMSDNANKMGTDISSIQDAYQGFAKQNYTMLDNLKLGYGGTQSEMIRLINDSGILNEEISSLDGITFDQMIEAIHVIQTNLGITGTTALEAGTTIQGSWGSVQALFQNILTKVGSELAPTIMGFLQQLSAWMETIDWDAFADSVGNAFGTALEWIQQIDFTTFFQNGIDGVTSFVSTMGDLVTGIVDAISWFNEYKGILSVVATVIVSVVSAFATFSVINKVVGFVKGAKTAFMGLWAVISANPIVAVISLIALIVTAIITLWNTNEDFRNAVIAIWEAIKTAFSTVVDAIKGFFTGLVDTVTTVWNTISETISSVFETIKTVVSTALTVISDTFTNIWNGITSFLSGAWETIKNVVNVGIQFIAELLNAAFTILTLPWQFIWENFGSYLVEAWETIKTTVSNALTAIQTVISTVWNAIVSFLSPILEGIKTTFTTVWNAIQTVITTVVNAIKSVIETVWNAIRTSITTVMNAIKTVFSTVWNAIKTVVTTVINAIKTVITTVFNAVKSTVTGILNSIKSTFSSVWNGIKSVVSGAVNGIKSTISSGMNAAKNTISNVLNAIKSKFSSIWSSATSIVSGAISKIKGFFNFSWSLPKIKLPHFSISGSFSLNPPSIPHFSVSWYKKAMEDGMIMNEPTIFGFNPKTNQLMAGGEAGSETVVGTDSLMQMIGSAIAANNEVMIEKFDRLISILAEFFPEVLSGLDRQIVLDTGVVAGELAPKMDEKLGRISNHKERGN